MTDRTPAPPADVCIVGAGPAGAMLAASLADRGHDVVVLEAGPRFDRGERGRRMERALRPDHDDDIWEMGGERDRFTTSGPVDYGLNAARVKGVGGTTLHWGAMTPRLHPEDFEMATRYGVGADWPISYADLEPYYLRAERAMGVAGAASPFGGARSGPHPMAPVPPSYSDGLLAEGFDAEGIALHPVPRAINTAQYDGRSECVGYGTCDPVCPSGAKYDATVHVRKAAESGARVVDRAPVQRLEHDADGERVVAAEYATPDGETHRQEARCFVVACGAVESVRLLLLSRSSQYPDGLANESGELGHYFMEHPGVRVRGRLEEPTRQHLIGYSTSMSEQYYAYDRGPEGTIILECSNTAGRQPVETALEQLPLSGRLLRGDVAAAFERDRWGERHLERVADEATRHVSINAWVEQLPDRDNRVSLDRSRTDDRGNPVPEVAFDVDERTRAALERAEAVCRDVLAAVGATDLRTNPESGAPFWTAHHQMGVTRMGSDPDASVLDPTLRTHDLSNLYVSSSGAFPTSGAANPTLTIAALTLRLADHLDGRLGSA
jgi:choline dehydrogenase-like flavoprotein